MKIERIIFDRRLICMPTYATPGSAALDMRACTVMGQPIKQPFQMYPGERAMIGAGFALHLTGIDNPTPVAALLIPRSGLGNKGMRLSNTIGLIDSDFLGEIQMAIEWHGADPLTIHPNERIAQLFICPFIRATLVDVPMFSRNTERGTGGFGSTGVA